MPRSTPGASPLGRAAPSRPAAPSRARPWTALARFATACVRQRPGDAAAALRAARRAGVPRRAAEETALMLVAHAGYPAGLEALRELNAAWPGRPRRTAEGDRPAWRRRGRRLCARVYGPVTDRLLAGLDALHPDLRAWVVEDGYGRVLARPGLAAVDRERIAVAVLAATGWERQLVSHALGARRMGASARSVRDAVALGLRDATAARRRAAARAWWTAFGRRLTLPGGQT